MITRSRFSGYKLYAFWLQLLGSALIVLTLPVSGHAADEPSWYWSGAATDSTFVVKAGFLTDGLVVRLAVGDSCSAGSQVYSNPQTVHLDQSNGVLTFSVSDLPAATAYSYWFELDGVENCGVAGRSKTAPSGASSFTIALGSCARTGSSHQVFSTIRSLQPDFFLHMGDFHYENIGTNDINRFRTAYQEVLTSVTQSALYHDLPVVYMWDDHDFGPNNSDSTSASRPASRAAYQEHVPHYRLAFGGGDNPIGYAFSYGRVRFIVCDSRSSRSPASSPDNTSKTVLGVAQKAWLKHELAKANGRYPLIVWVNTFPWIGESGDDGWHLYTNERHEIAQFIKENNIQGLCMLSGDAHMLAIDDGTNSDYADGGGAAFPVFHAAALDQFGSVKGGPYSHGAYPGGGHFGLMTVTDFGDSTISVQWSGRNYLNNELVGYSFSVPVRNVVCGDADGNGEVRIDDAVLLMRYIFLGSPQPPTLSNGDANGSGSINISDVVYLVNYAYLGGPAPTCE